jgi:hypothetical protein
MRSWGGEAFDAAVSPQPSAEPSSEYRCLDHGAGIEGLGAAGAVKTACAKIFGIACGDVIQAILARRRYAGASIIYARSLH